MMVYREQRPRVARASARNRRWRELFPSAAHVYVDDRAICFDGDFEKALERIAAFKARWEK